MSSSLDSPSGMLLRSSRRAWTSSSGRTGVLRISRRSRSMIARARATFPGSQAYSSSIIPRVFVIWSDEPT